MKNLVLFSLLFACFHPLFGQTTQLLKTEADSLYKLGDQAVNEGNLDFAVANFKAATQKYSLLKDNKGLFYTSDGMGWVNFYLGDMPGALDEFNNSLQFARNGIDSSLAYKALNNIGLIHYTNGDYLKASGLLNYVAANSKNINDYYNLSFSLKQLGDLYWRLGIYDKAVLFLNEVLLLAIQNQDHYLIASVKGTLGAIYINQYQYDRAKSIFRDVLNFGVKENNVYAMESAYHNLSTNDARNEFLDSAQFYLLKSIEINRQIGQKRSLVSNFNNLALLYIKQNKLEVAGRYLDSSFTLVGGHQINSSVSAIYNRKGLILQKSDKHKDAIEYFIKSENIASQVETNNFSRISNLLSLSESFYFVNQDSNDFYFNLADSLLDGIVKKQINLNFSNPVQVAQFNGQINQRISTLIKRGNISEAIKVYEKNKAKSLIQDLSFKQNEIEKSINLPMRIKKGEILDKISRIEKQIVKEKSDSLKETLRKELNFLELEYDAILVKIKTEDPAYSKFKIQPTLSTYQAQQICDDQTIILEFAMTESDLIGLAITQNEVKPWIIEKAGNNKRATEAINEAVKELLNKINSHGNQSEIDSGANWLATYLLQPAETLLKGKKKLIIVPDGILAYLPFEVLKYKNKYLIESFEISYTPSLTALTLLDKPKENYKKEILIVSNPDYIPIIRRDKDSLRGPNVYLGSVRSSQTITRGLTREVRTGNNGMEIFFAPLDETKTEGERIGDLFSNPDILTEENATESLVKKKDLSQYRFLHFATHGFLNESKPELSGLVLSQADTSSAGSGEDGYLRASEIYTLNLSSEMVTLSACQTGLGKNIRGEGVLGLQRAFLYAGASSVVVSLWGVSDKSTAILMSDFYDEVIDQDPKWYNKLINFITFRTKNYQPASKAKAMREAKTAMINSPEYSHPFNWAPFIIIGK
ncbi:MAG: CHAT domain-containing protein [Bacteroidetes bacterium]|nr:CHAT domain-containing protein [Bacteroidota bacterium]